MSKSERKAHDNAWGLDFGELGFVKIVPDSYLGEAIRKNPSFLTATNDFGFTMLPQLALAGSYDGVDVCLKMGFNPKQVAPNGMTPYRLAKSLGWPKVMDRLTQAGAGE